MSIFNKKMLFISYLIIIAINFFFRTVAYNVFEYIYVFFVLLLSTSIINQYRSHRDVSYFIPVLLVSILGIGLTILGITGYNNQVFASLVTTLGISLIGVSAIVFLLKRVVDHTVFSDKVVVQKKVTLFYSFILFTFYFTLISPQLSQLYEDYNMGVFWIILISLLVSMIYFGLNFLFKKGFGIRGFDMIYAAILTLFVVRVILLTSVITPYTIMQELFVMYIVSCVYICLYLIFDIFKQINIED